MDEFDRFFKGVLTNLPHRFKWFLSVRFGFELDSRVGIITGIELTVYSTIGLPPHTWHDQNPYKYKVIRRIL